MQQEFGSKMFVFLCLMILVRDIEADVDYCAENPDHILCGVDCVNYVRKDYRDCLEYRVVSFWKGWEDDVVEIHNEIRSDVITGKIKGASNKNFKKGRNMMKMKWDELLKCSAQVQADVCQHSGSQDEMRVIDDKIIGEVSIIDASTIWNHTTKDTTFQYFLREKTFDNEANKIDVTSVGRFSETGVGLESIANAGQMLFGSNFMVGCSASSYIAQGTRYKMIVCHYGPKIVEEGDTLYELFAENEKSCDSDNETGLEPHLCNPGENYPPNLYPPSKRGPETDPETSEETPASTGANSKPFCCNVAIVFFAALLLPSW